MYEEEGGGGREERGGRREKDGPSWETIGSLKAVDGGRGGATSEASGPEHDGD